MRKAVLAVLTFIGITSGTAALAIPVTWHLAGEITEGNQGAFFFPFQVNAGDPIAFDFSFESDAACVLCEDTQRVYENPLTAFSLTVGSTVFDLPIESSSILVRNDWPSPAGGFFIDALAVSLAGVDSSGIVFTSDLVMQNTSPTPPVSGVNDVELANLLPPDASLLADPTLSFFNISASLDGGFDSFSGRFLPSSVGPTPVPEPSVLVLLASGVLLMGFMHGRVSRKRSLR